MDPFVLKEKEYFFLPNWVRRFPDLTVGFTTKNGGNSTDAFDSLNMGFHVKDMSKAVCDNRRMVAEKLNFSTQNWVGAQQTHEINIKKISKGEKGKGAMDYETAFNRMDGFYTFDRGVLLTLCFADCVPIYFLHPKSRAIGVAHAGWKGTVNGIAHEMVRNFQSEGIQANEISVVIGPSICENCYIVDDYVMNLVHNKLEGVVILPYNEISAGQYQLNLKECNKQILLKAGVLQENIQVTNLCTSCQKEHFYSHRRDQGKTGRMISFIGWKEANY
jgi:polyphenol oxidase